MLFVIRGFLLGTIGNYVGKTLAVKNYQRILKYN